jgi:hypothetical protein
MSQRKRPPSQSKRPDSGQLPTRQISETLLEFAAPLLEHPPDHLSPQRLEHVLIFPITIWNAVILDDRGAMPGFLAQARARVALAQPPVPLALFDFMVERKRSCFGDDHRLIGRHSVRVDTDGTFHIQAEAHLPPRRRPRDT